MNWKPVGLREVGLPPAGLEHYFMVSLISLSPSLCLLKKNAHTAFCTFFINCPFLRATLLSGCASWYQLKRVSAAVCMPPLFIGCYVFPGLLTSHHPDVLYIVSYFNLSQ